MDARHHIDELQSLRGVAALTVVISHMSSIYMVSRGVRVTIDAVFNPHASVIIFFVLSGYVLSGSLQRRGLSWKSVSGFYVNRLFRLFPALWAASVVSAILMLLFPQTSIRPTITLWFFLYVRPFPSLYQLILATLAIDRSLIMPVWTIFIELVGSAIVPLFFAVAQANKRLFICLLLTMCPLSYALAHAPHRINSLAFMIDFALGVWLASRKWKFFAANSLIQLGSATVTLVLFRFVWFSVQNGHAMQLYGYDDPLPALVESIAAFWVVGVLASARGHTKFLRKRAVIWLGDVSYGLYLIHFPIAVVLVKLFSRVFASDTSAALATALLMSTGLAVSLALADLIHRLVELPSIQLGKRASHWLFPREFQALRPH